MNIPLFTKLSLDSNGIADECSQPVSIEGNNAAQWDATVYALTATNVSTQLEVSNDMENWTAVGTAQTTTAVGHQLFTADKDISAAYVRLRVSLTGTGTAVLAASVNIAPL